MTFIQFLKYIITLIKNSLMSLNLALVPPFLRFIRPYREWLFRIIYNVHRSFHRILIYLRLDYQYLEFGLVWTLWAMTIECVVYILYTAFKILDACGFRVAEALKDCIRTCRISLNKPLGLVLLTHVSILISAVYHIVFHSHSIWMGPIIDQFYFFNEFPTILNNNIVHPEKWEWRWNLNEVVSNWALLPDPIVYTKRIPLTQFPYLAPYENINDRYQVYSSTHFLSQEASLRPYSNEPADRVLFRRRSYFGRDVGGYVSNTYRTYNPYFQRNDNHIPNPFNGYYPYRLLHYPTVNGNYKALNYMICRSANQIGGSWDPEVIGYLLRVRDVLAWDARNLTLEEVVNFGNFCEIVHGYKAGALKGTVYSDIRFPL
jgi:hypothetical protein